VPSPSKLIPDPAFSTSTPRSTTGAATHVLIAAFPRLTTTPFALESTVASNMSHQQRALPRYFANDAALSRRDPYKQLVATLTHIVTKYPPDSVKPGGL
jgi:hypothetical protein